MAQPSRAQPFPVERRPISISPRPAVAQPSPYAVATPPAYAAHQNPQMRSIARVNVIDYFISDHIKITTSRFRAEILMARDAIYPNWRHW